MSKCCGTPERNVVYVKGEMKTEDPIYIKFAEIEHKLEQIEEQIHDDDGIDERLDKIESLFGVGAVWISVSNLDPGDLFGGTWTKLEDKFLLCSGTVPAEQTGGSNDREISIQLANLPAHNHHLHWNTISANGGGGDESWCNRYIVESGTGTKVTTIGGLDYNYENTPGAVPADYPGMGNTEFQNGANNRPVAENTQAPITFTVTPEYVAVNVWKRIA